MRSLLVLAMVFLLSSCGHVMVDHQPKAGMPLGEAVSIIEQVFFEDYVPQQRPSRVSVGPEYITLSDGIVTSGVSSGMAAPIGNGAVVIGSSETSSREAGARIYYRSLGRVTMHARKFKSNRYVILIRNSEGSVLRRVNTTSQSKAESFIDALESLKHLSTSPKSPVREAAPQAI